MNGLLLGQSLVGFTPIFFRTLGILSVMPFGHDGSAISKRLGLSALSGLTLGQFIMVTRSASTIDYGLEFIIGAVIGLPTAIVVASAGMLGDLFDTNRGQNLGSLYDPINGASSSASAVIFSSYVWISLLLLGLGEVLAQALITSFDRLPAYTLTTHALGPLSMAVIRLISATMFGALRFYLPFVAIYLAVELSFGILAKAIPQLSLQNENFQIKTYLGMLFVIGLCGAFDFRGVFEMVRPHLSTLFGG